MLLLRRQICDLARERIIVSFGLVENLLDEGVGRRLVVSLLVFQCLFPLALDFLFFTLALQLFNFGSAFSDAGCA